MPWDPLILDIFWKIFLKMSFLVKFAQKGPPDFGCSKTRRAISTKYLSRCDGGVGGVRFGISAVRIPCHEGKTEVIFLPRRYADGICASMAIRAGGHQAIRCRAIDCLHIGTSSSINRNTGNADRGHRITRRSGES